VIAHLTGQGYSARDCCRILDVSRAGYLLWKRRGPTPQELRRHWLTGLIREVHAASRGTYGRRRVLAELVIGRQIAVNKKLVARIMTECGLFGLPIKKVRRGPSGAVACSDLVRREFRSDQPNRLWMTDITEHFTREGKVYCCAVLDAHSRRVVGWSIDTSQTAALVTNALGMAITNRRPGAGAVVHSDHGSQFTSWVFSQRVSEAGLMPSMGKVGSAVDNAMMESFWARMQTELLDRQKWNTRLQLANEMFEYLEIFHNRIRRHSSLGMLTPIEFEEASATSVNPSNR
jgi:putative transposase